MKTRGQIRMDFAKARMEAERLDNIAAQLKACSTGKMEESMNRLSQAWTGTNSRLFLQKESVLQADIIRTAKDLNNIAADIRRIAKRVYDAEIRAYNIAMRRSSR